MKQTPLDPLRRWREEPAAEQEGASGRTAAEALSDEADEAIAALWERLGPGSGCVVAVGDLGCRMLAPGSRIELLVLHPETPEASRGAEQAVKALAFELWSAGIEVSSSVHPAAEVAELAARSVEMESAVLDGRLLAGDASLWDGVRTSVLERARSDAGAFLVRVRRATAGRRLEVEDATAALEPNLEDGRGGLADVAAIRRIETVCGPPELPANLPADPPAGRSGVPRPDLVQRRSQLDAATDLLHRARAALHRQAGRGTDLLELSYRPGVAEALFGADAGAASEITLMRLLYEQCRVVAATLDSVLDPASGPPAAAARFAGAFDSELPGGPGSNGMWPPEATRAFLDILASGVEGRPSLLALDASGMLTRTIPEWAGIRCLPERRSYHRFSVDEHSFRAVAALGTLTSDPDQRVRAAAATVLGKGKENDADTLRLATLLHDVGKGGEQDHSERGADLARTIIERMGLGEDVAADVAWLVRNHLLLAHMATRRDIGDEALMLEVADRVGTERRLHLLYLLTVADGRATSPTAWTLWKATLTGRLYSRVLEALRRDEGAGDDSAQRIRARRDEVRAALADLPRGPVEAHLEAMPDAWLMSQPVTALAGQSRLVIDFHPADEVRMHAAPLAGAVPASPERPPDRLWELTVIGRDRPGLFSRVSGVLALHDLNVLGAEIYTRADGIALEVFRLEALSEDQRWFERVADDARKALRGRISLGLRLAEKRNDPLGGRPPGPPPRVVVDNEASERWSVVEVHAADRIGLLYTITHALAELEVDIQLAKVSTYGKEVVDVFYVADLDGQKLTDPAYISEIQALVTYSISGAR
ncbi:MAG TPA: ACT domain-containing protein [Actinomycetota bacterium]